MSFVGFRTTLLVLALMTVSAIVGIVHAKSPMVRVGLTDRMQSVAVSSKGGMSVQVSGKETILAYPLIAKVDWNGARLSLTVLSATTTDGTSPGTLTVDSIRFRAASPEYLEVNNSRYRGTLELHPAKSGIRIINELPMEEYLYSVVPSEMPPSWSAEALKAQAVAARTYTIRNILRHSTEGFSLCATEHCQVYKGVASETSRTNQAVTGTEGIVAVYGGKPIDAQYHSSSGGATEDSQFVYPGTVPYLKAVDSPETDCPYTAWVVEFTASDITARFAKAGYGFGTILDILPVKIGRSGRFTTALVRGSLASAELGGTKLRSVLGLNSTLFVVERVLPFLADGLTPDTTQPPTGYRIYGRGFGHGVGLSQYGARTMAELGNTFDTILKHYYTGIELEKWSF